MSGRSAYVRKKGTETSGHKGGSRARPGSSTSSDNSTLNRVPIRPVPGPHHDRRRERYLMADELTIYAHGLPPSSIDAPRQHPDTSGIHGSHDPAADRARRQTGKTDDVSGIEKSGLRSVLDKKSDEVRKGLAKAFMFKKDRRRDDAGTPVAFRPESAATVRPSHNTGHDHAERAHGPVLLAQHPVALQDLIGTVPSPSTILATVPESNLPPIKRWMGSGKPVQRWNKLRKDPELWDPNGDVLIFFGHRQDSSQLDPSLRLSSHVIEATESRHLITLLREGSTEEDDHILPSSAANSAMLQRHGSNTRQQLSPGGFGHHGRSTPSNSDHSGLWEIDGQISYKMYFPAPSNLTTIETLQYHITTRNVFSLLQHASLVGFSLCQALTDLHSRLDAYMSPDVDTASAILNYLSARGIDDVRNDAETAVSLLAWSEGRETRWEDGWREAFLHCAGMYPCLESCDDLKHVTPITRALLERASLEMQLRVQSAEERLATFEYGDIWPPAVAITASTSGPVVTAPAKAAMDRLRLFFVQHYKREFGEWPPPAPQEPHSGGGEEGIWLTRTVAQLLQRDFGALYDYLVNRDIVWDESEARPSRKWMMVSESGNRGFEADTPDLPMTDMLIEFDNKYRFPHIPHPYPLVPDAIPAPPATGIDIPLAPSGIFSTKLSKKNGTTSAKSGRAGGAAERRIQLAYTEATNICILGSDFTHSNLVDAFTKFEKADRIGEVDPSTARRGRWVLIYAILQTLASVSVDAPTVRYSADVLYHLSPRLRGVKIPPWRKSGGSRGDQLQQQQDEAAHELSHCWTVPATWASASASGGDTTNSEAEMSSNEEGGGGGGVSPVGYYGPGIGNGDGGGGGGRRGSYFLMPMPATSLSPTTTTRRAVGGQPSSSIRSATPNSSSRAPSFVGSASSYTNTTAGTGATPFSSSASAASVLSYSGSETGSSGGLRSPSSPAGGVSVSVGGGGGAAAGSWQGPFRPRQVLAVEEQEWAVPGHGHGPVPGSVPVPIVRKGPAAAAAYVHGPLPLPPTIPRVGAQQKPGKGMKGNAKGMRKEQDRLGGRARVLLAEGDSFLDEEVDVDGDSFVLMPYARPGRSPVSRTGGKDREGRGGSGTEAGDVGPVIRDFDELGVID